MFDLKNPGKMLGMLKMIGIKPETIIEKMTALAMEKLQEYEQRAGAKLGLFIIRDDTTEEIIASFYKIGEANSLELHETHSLTKLLNSLTNDSGEINNKQVANIGTAYGTTTTNQQHPNGTGAKHNTGADSNSDHQQH